MTDNKRLSAGPPRLPAPSPVDGSAPQSGLAAPDSRPDAEPATEPDPTLGPLSPRVETASSESPDVFGVSEQAPPSGRARSLRNLLKGNAAMKAAKAKKEASGGSRTRTDGRPKLTVDDIEGFMEDIISDRKAPGTYRVSAGKLLHELRSQKAAADDREIPASVNAWLERFDNASPGGVAPAEPPQPDNHSPGQHFNRDSLPLVQPKVARVQAPPPLEPKPQERTETVLPTYIGGSPRRDKR